MVTVDIFLLTNVIMDFTKSIFNLKVPFDLRKLTLFTSISMYNPYNFYNLIEIGSH